jgi:hypothetical protein
MEPIITEWFNSRQFGTSPSEAISILTNIIEADIEDFGLDFECDTDLFRKKLSTALCVLYKLNLENKASKLNFPINHAYPANWGPEFEIMWIDYLEHKFFSVEYWDSIWDTFSTMDWEADVFNWREELQALVPCYIRRNLQKLHDDEMSDDNKSEEEMLIPSHDDY